MTAITDRQRLKQAEKDLSALELMAEQAYRRGFAQGVHAALQYVGNGHSEHRLERWRKAVFDWRTNLRWVKSVYTNQMFKDSPPELPALAARRVGK